MEQQTEFALRAMQTLNFRALCQQYGISTKTGYKWRERFWRKGISSTSAKRTSRADHRQRERGPTRFCIAPGASRR